MTIFIRPAQQELLQLSQARAPTAQPRCIPHLRAFAHTRDTNHQRYDRRRTQHSDSFASAENVPSQSASVPLPPPLPRSGPGRLHLRLYYYIDA